MLAAARHGLAGRDERAFANVTPHAIAEPGSCPRSRLALVDALGLRREPVVFAVVETERLAAPGLRRRVVEGVETAAECRWAVAHGADHVQGYCVARPAVPPPRPGDAHAA